LGDYLSSGKADQLLVDLVNEKLLKGGVTLQDMALDASNAAGKAWTWGNTPLISHTHKAGEGKTRMAAEEVGMGLTTPISLATMAAGGGAAAAGARGMLGASNAARLTEAALQAPMVAEGVTNMLSGDKDSQTTGAIQTALGLMGTSHALSRRYRPQAIQRAYLASERLPYDPSAPEARVDPQEAMARADAYEAAQHNPNDPATARSYEAMNSQIYKQYEALKNAGVKMEPWTKEGQPYKNSAEMVQDVEKNGHLYYFQSEAEGGLGQTVDEAPGNPLMKRDPANGLLYNDMLRAVHDYFGHAIHKFQFGPIGEEGAWMEHRKMFTPEAVPALTTETRGQNSWVNYGPQMRDEAGNLIKKGEPGYLSPTERKFAVQKTMVLPERFSVPTAQLSDWATFDAKTPQLLRSMGYGDNMINAARQMAERNAGKFNINILKK
jgi:hypothetical protein